MTLPQLFRYCGMKLAINSIPVMELCAEVVCEFVDNFALPAAKCRVQL